MSLADQFAAAEDVYARTITHETWGHLAPVPEEVYAGFALFTHGYYGDVTVIDWTFETVDGIQLEDSPWVYEDLHETLNQRCVDKGKVKLGPSEIYRFHGTYRRKADVVSKSGRLVREGKGVFKGHVSRVCVGVLPAGYRSAMRLK
jgi:hypothetical protein